MRVLVTGGGGFIGSHVAAMVGLGNGVADAAEYVSRNDLGTAVLYTCVRHRVGRPGPRAVANLDAGRFTIATVSPASRPRRISVRSARTGSSAAIRDSHPSQHSQHGT